jgi:hypothetical protein
MTAPGTNSAPPRASRSSIGGWVIAVLAAAASLYAAGLLYEGYASKTYSSLMTFPFVDAPAAERAYAALPASASGAARVAASARLALGDPANPQRWAAVAYADWRARGEMTPAAVAALDHSYALGFFDRSIAVWRVSFALQHWDRLTPEIRQDALAEARTALQDRTLAPLLRKALTSISNPSGRVAAALLLLGAKPAP